MVITYVIKNSLYVNITNHCTNRCEFCIRDRAVTEPFVNLKLEREPTFQEIIADLSTYKLDQFDEIVFCGYGEPTCRLYDMLAVCRTLREVTSTKIRVNTNGHASLILNEDTPPLFKGLVDVVSISLNAADSDTYMKLCHPKFGDDTFIGIMKFAREIVKYVPKVIFTVIEKTIPDSDIERCAQIAAEIGAGFRVREYM